MRRFLPWLFLGLLVVGSGIGAHLGAAGVASRIVHPKHLLAQRQTPELNQPDLVGLPLAQAKKIADAAHLPLSVLRYPTSAPVGQVLQQVSFHPTILIVSGTRPRNLRARLRHTVGPPVRSECVGRFGLDPDSEGNAGPALCRGGHVNVATWDYFAASDPPLLRLGRHPTMCQVAFSYDETITDAMNKTVYELASAYYGWRFPASLPGQLSNAQDRHRLCGIG